MNLINKYTDGVHVLRFLPYTLQTEKKDKKYIKIVIRIRIYMF